MVKDIDLCTSKIDEKCEKLQPGKPATIAYLEALAKLEGDAKKEVDIAGKMTWDLHMPT